MSLYNNQHNRRPGLHVTGQQKEEYNYVKGYKMTILVSVSKDGCIARVDCFTTNSSVLCYCSNQLQQREYT